jgi:glycosyltransferase involved in cell wall biosynthesis
MTSTLVIVPAWNEESTVGAVVAGIRATGYEVLVIDDGSTDATAVAARSAGAVVVRLPFNLGVGGALRCGFRYAVSHGYDQVVQCDADGQHPPSHIDALVREQARTGAHMLLGSRYHPEADGFSIGFVRRTVQRLLARSASKATGTPIHDVTSGFRVISQPLLGAFAREFPAHYLGDTYEAVTTAGRAGYCIVETPVGMLQREHGASSASPIAAARFTARALLVVATRLHFSIPPYRGAPTHASPERS